jgi:predicted membrane channel-forming protein YqfA (hemolysin III family)
LERELITGHEANLLMVAVLIAAPLVGFLWGWAVKRAWRGLSLGIFVGAGNFGLWVVYNRITDRLGLDTVKNLLVNLALFAVIGIAVGLGAARWGAGTGRRNT